MSLESMIQQDSITIKRLTPGSDWNSDGTWSTIITVLGRIDTNGGTTSRLAGKNTSIGTHTGFFLYKDLSTTPPIEEDRLVFGSQNYRVIYVSNPANKNRHYELSLELVKGSV